MLRLFVLGVSALGFGLSLATYADSAAQAVVKQEKYTGTATRKGEIVYIEQHVLLTGKSGDVLRSETNYQDVDGKIIATLSSDYTPSFNAPSYTFTDKKTAEAYGLRYENGRMIMFDKTADKPEKFKDITDEFKDKDILIIAGQGLINVIRQQYAELKERKTVPIAFLIPGKLDYYMFKLEFLKEEPNQVAHFQVKITNWFLRLFVSRLYIVYDVKNRKLVEYRGLSNIQVNGEPAQVDIFFSDTQSGPEAGIKTK